MRSSELAERLSIRPSLKPSACNRLQCSTAYLRNLSKVRASHIRSTMRKRCRSTELNISRCSPTAPFTMTAGSSALRRPLPHGLVFSCRTSIAYNWELYKVNDDCSEPNDLAAREPKTPRVAGSGSGQKLPNTLRLPLASILRRER